MRLRLVPPGCFSWTLTWIKPSLERAAPPTIAVPRTPIPSLARKIILVAPQRCGELGPTLKRWAKMFVRPFGDCATHPLIDHKTDGYLSVLFESTQTRTFSS